MQVVIPLYDDWVSACQLLPLIDAQLHQIGVAADILLADDGSQVPVPDTWDMTLTSIRRIRILRLQRNLGHQRAICVALCHLLTESTCERILVMDGDGEDSPADISRLLSQLDHVGSAQVVFAERMQRSEGWSFSWFYFVYRVLHRLLVGHQMRVGNFSVMNRKCLESLCTSSELWNHYAGAVFATRQPISMVATNRGKRLAGKSKMNFPALVMHGLTALSVFSDRISTRLLIVSACATGATIVGMLVVTFIRVMTGLAIPGWATNAFGVLLLLLVQLVTFMLTFCFLVLFTRGLAQFIPVRDYKYFILRTEEVWHGGES